MNVKLENEDVVIADDADTAVLTVEKTAELLVRTAATKPSDRDHMIKTYYVARQAGLILGIPPNRDCSEHVAHIDEIKAWYAACRKSVMESGSLEVKDPKRVSEEQAKVDESKVVIK